LRNGQHEGSSVRRFALYKRRKGVVRMNNSSPFCRERRGLLLLFTLGLVLFLLPRSAAQAQSTTQDPKAAASASDTVAQTEAQKKAAERKKHFEEQKMLLDGNAAPGEKHAPVTDSVFWMNPIGVNMVADQTQEVHVWDTWGNDVSARASWSLSNTGIVDLQVKHHAIITAKMPGTVSVLGTVEGHTVEAIVTVYRGEKLPPGIPPFVTKQPPLMHRGRYR
jgi:hypothetical protein